jgi:L-threonylcarbamoyladenylate synthase
MFEKNIITAFPTDTSWGLGVRADDVQGLENVARLKKRKPEQMFSLMVRDFAMLREFAEVPKDFLISFFNEKPRTAILKPKEILPKSEFWPETSVAFRIATIPEVAVEITYPITATSANFTGKPAIFSAQELKKQFKDAVLIFPDFETLVPNEPSEIWDFTAESPKQIR